MPIKHRAEETHIPNGLAPEETLMTRATNLTNRLSPQLQGYLALAVGAFFLLFGLGFFSFIKVGIGILGIALIAWGALRSQLLSKVTSWFQNLAKRF